MIVIKNLRKEFDGHAVLKDINEHIKPGEVVVIIGPSGSGKSTFLRCLNLMEFPSSGSIYFQGGRTCCEEFFKSLPLGIGDRLVVHRENLLWRRSVDLRLLLCSEHILERGELECKSADLYPFLRKKVAYYPQRADGRKNEYEDLITFHCRVAFDSSLQS